MRVETDIKMGFKDVLIRPKRSTMKSRALVELERAYTFLHSKKEWKGVPVMAANMDTIGTFEVAEVLARHGMLTAIHKHYDEKQWARFLDGRDSDIFRRIMVSCGSSEGDLVALKKIMAAHPELEFICVDVANGYARNYLLPRKMALVANLGNQAVYLEVRRQRQAQRSVAAVVDRLEGSRDGCRGRAGRSGSDRLEPGDLVILFVREEELDTVRLLFPGRDPS